MKSLRKIISGHDADGASCFIEDVRMVAPYHPGGNTAHSIFEVWRSESTPASNVQDWMPSSGSFKLAPPKGGTAFRIIDLPPDSQRDFSKMAGVFKAYGAADVLDHKKSAHAAFHRTNSLDYAVVLEGEVWAVMDKGETLMSVGDVLIQRGTNHAWSNRSSSNCRLLFVLIDATPIDKESLQ